METCGERICKALRIRNLKQSDLVERTGIPKSAISQYCSGSFKPKQKRLFEIAMALDVDEAWLMGLDVPMERRGTTDTVEQPPKFHIAVNMADDLTPTEQTMIRKFRALDDRGQAAVMNVLDHEYSSLPGSTAEAAPKEA